MEKSLSCFGGLVHSNVDPLSPPVPARVLHKSQGSTAARMRALSHINVLAANACSPPNAALRHDDGQLGAAHVAHDCFPQLHAAQRRVSIHTSK